MGWFERIKVICALDVIAITVLGVSAGLFHMASVAMYFVAGAALLKNV
jgi:hypothetical protein